jgi:nucleoside-diphosphate-sugar epimerase
MRLDGCVVVWNDRTFFRGRQIVRVFLTGGTGHIGSAVLGKLQEAGHSVVAAVRSEKSASAVGAAGATAVIGDLTDSAWVAMQLRQVDGAIHAAVPDDASPAAFDDAVISAALDAFGGTDKPFLYTTGIWVYGSGTDVRETDPFDAPELTSWREERQRRLLEGGIDARVIAPGIVYGYGKGIPNVISGAPRTQSGAVTLVGSGDQHWTTVHVDDLADLYVLVLEKGKAGEVYIGASGINPTVRELGEAVAGAGGVVAPDEADATRERLGAGFADALMLDQQTSASKPKSELGWNPSRQSMVEELSSGS